jgi:hypothetical protein
MFFHIPRVARFRIIVLLNVSVLLQFMQQICRHIYPSFDASEKSQPGQLLIMGSFVVSILCSVGAAGYQFKCLYHLHSLQAERFPPSSIVVAVQHACHAWTVRGERNCCKLLSGTLKEFQEAEKKAKTPGKSPQGVKNNDFAPASANAEALERAKKANTDRAQEGSATTESPVQSDAGALDAPASPTSPVTDSAPAAGAPAASAPAGAPVRVNLQTAIEMTDWKSQSWKSTGEIAASPEPSEPDTELPPAPADPTERDSSASPRRSVSEFV